MTVEEITAVYDGRCPDCGGPITEGPHGGASVNMLCYGCGSRFNVLDPETVSAMGIVVSQFAGTSFCERLDKMSPGELSEMKKRYP